MNISRKLDAVLKKYNLMPPCGKMQMLRKIKKDKAEGTDNMWWVDYDTELKTVTPDYEKVIKELDGILNDFGLKIGQKICYENKTNGCNRFGHIARFWRNDPQDEEPNKWYVGVMDFGETLRPWNREMKNTYRMFGRCSGHIDIDECNEKYFLDSCRPRTLGRLMADLSIRHNLDMTRHYNVWICGMDKDEKIDTEHPFACCHFYRGNERLSDIDKWFGFGVEDYRFEFSKSDVNDTNFYAEYLVYDEEKDEERVTEEVIRDTPHNEYWLFVKLIDVRKLNC